jgi:hypothetical protein
MSKATLYDFNPRNTGLYEAQLWKAYYDRNWPQALLLVFRLLRSQFNLSALQAALATYYSVRAAMAWAPRQNDAEMVRTQLRRFYAVLRAATGAAFNPDAAGDAELEYWTVHRRIDGKKGHPELTEALARIAAEVYGLSIAEAQSAGAARAHAADLVDDITAGRQEPSREAWSAIADSLRRAYSLLREATAISTRICGA